MNFICSCSRTSSLNYQPQAKHKNVNLEIIIVDGNEAVAFAKNKLLQITGNLTPEEYRSKPYK